MKFAHNPVGNGEDVYWVYVFAKDGPNGLEAPVKVGITNSANSRLATIQTSCPFRIGMAYVFEVPNKEIAAHFERSFHRTQKSHRLHGEWFDIQPLDAIQILCIGYRVMLELTSDGDPKLIQSALDVSGVLWAEKKFGLSSHGGKPISMVSDAIQ